MRRSRLGIGVARQTDHRNGTRGTSASQSMREYSPAPTVSCWILSILVIIVLLGVVPRVMPTKIGTSASRSMEGYSLFQPTLVGDYRFDYCRAVWSDAVGHLRDFLSSIYVLLYSGPTMTWKMRDPRFLVARTDVHVC